MAEDVEPATGGKLRRRATIFMTGAALSALYVWMQPAALGTLEANSAQAAEGTPAGCVLNVAGTPLTVGGQEVRVQSSELCNGTKAAIVPAQPTPIAAAEPPADLLRTTIREEAKPLAPVERFSRASPRTKPLRPPELIAADDRPVAEPVADREDAERDHFRLAEREDRPDGPDEKPDDDRPEDGGEHSGDHDGGERDEVCERDDGGERGDDRDGGEGCEGG